MRPLEDDEPTVVGPYRLLGRLGSGGMGRVYLGRSAGGRTVAVKIVHPHFALDEEFRARFRREVAAARRVGGAWTAPVLDADPEARVPWVATAYAAGPSLTAAVADGGPLPAHSVRALGAGLGEALAAVHELGLVHRDVKPSNVLLTLDGPLLIDFGIARATGGASRTESGGGTASLTSTGVSIGSPGYMSPEQILGKGVTGAADVFSLGAVLAYATTGQPPFPGDSSAALLYKVVHEEPNLDGLDDGELRELVASCLAKDPSARPAPAEVARRLAPEGAARLVTGGWLPGALVEQVSRSVVRLLNLEAGESATGASGPVGFSRPSVTAGGDAGVATPASGVFGPPPVMPTPTSPSYPPSPPAPAPAPAPSPALLSVPGPRDPGPPDDDPGAGTGTTRPPGRLALSVAATSTQGAQGRGRRISCTVALAVAGALAAVTVGSVFVLDLLPGSGNDANNAGGNEASHDPPAATPGGLPARYLGTWEGQAAALDGKLPLGTFRITIKQAEAGQELGRLRQTDALGGVCVDVITLKKVTEKQLVAGSAGAEGNHDGCNPAPTTVTFTPVGDDLDYASKSEESGRPTARLSKVG
ncbi:serine/threonine protein kinase [Streptomyces lividans]|uniref:Serine/threonine protein kinase n=3 Tax=Streptomyces TaxID=1883 RepID=A0ABM5R1J4_STRLI|nr:MULTISPECIES: serine/threonine-protein kinase [Streptomyces]QSJ09656.1 serine/threonine protein kinase [Streptomyces lividans]AIJ14125.1 serine/threonine protein kinase [Streptomyces lividans TK24]KKD14821.1 serine/threonine protein kinase [Streptomyces sp. WM6391]QTD70580.1 serine/threonine protein kinase [Streptomyces lividans TK24] [Streptomyces lividans]BDE41143.1 serine/threonine protein kinase [Streptomyces lividans]